MKLPSSIASWCVLLYFLWVGVGAFVALPMAAIIGGVLALGYVVFTLIGK